MELRKKNRRVFGDFTGDNGKSYFPSRKLRIKTQIVFFCPEISLRLPGLFGDTGTCGMQAGCKAESCRSLFLNFYVNALLFKYERKAIHDKTGEKI